MDVGIRDLLAYQLEAIYLCGLAIDYNGMDELVLHRPANHPSITIIGDHHNKNNILTSPLVIHLPLSEL